MANTKITTNVIADNAVGITQLNVSDGSNGQALVTNGSGTLSFASVGVSGISSSADATAITITSSEKVGIGETSPQGILHVKSGDSGATADSGADELVVEGSGNTGISILSGASSSGAIYFGDSGLAYDGYIAYSQTNRGFNFATAGSVRASIDSSGNFGIGETSPTHHLHVNAGTTNVVAVFESSDAEATIRIKDSTGTAAIKCRNDFRFNKSETTELMRLNSSGQLGIGTTSPANTLHIHTDAGDEGLTIKSTGNTSNAIIFDANRSGAGSSIGEIQSKWNGTTVAMIASVTGSDTTNKDDGELIFYTSSANNIAEKMRIASDGNIGIGTTDTANAKLVFNGAISSGADTAMIDFDGFGTRGEGSSQSINFRMGRTGQATDQPAQIKSFFMGGGATAGQTSIGFKFVTISANTQQDQFLIDAAYSRFKFNTDESPQSNNPQTNNCIIIGPSSSGAITQSLTNACVLQNRGGELYACDSSHNNTQLTPHNWGLISAGPSEELAWTYYSQRPNPSNNEQLQTINVDMAKVVRKVEDLVGEKLIYTENSEKDGHTFKTIISDIQTTLADLKTRVEALEG